MLWPHCIHHGTRHRKDQGRTQLVWIVRLIGSAKPRMRRHDGLVGEIDESGGVLAHNIPNSPTVLRQRHGLDPLWIIRRCFLLEESRLRDSVGEALHSDGPA